MVYVRLGGQRKFRSSDSNGVNVLQGAKVGSGLTSETGGGHLDISARQKEHPPGLMAKHPPGLELKYANVAYFIQETQLKRRFHPMYQSSYWVKRGEKHCVVSACRFEG
ncbi:hypothetical protein CEXT_228911 [Caerostris extrusa]|uniref:Uncharacterized protein n=1 Tax=Caerostris extrusa TaxID=172846 RepID=A0AAV4NSN5_CAEEX|nr:hypothetical protein CEXT_228911 [Caerostris extrusa]